MVTNRKVYKAALLSYSVMESLREKQGLKEFISMQTRKARTCLLTDILGELAVIKIGYVPSARNICNLVREYKASPCHYLANRHPKKY